MKLEITPSPSFSSSPFPSQIRRGEENLSNGTTIQITPGTTIPEYIRKVYGNREVHPVVAPFSFLSRDMDSKVYKSEQTDPYVFNAGRDSINKFKKHAISIIAVLAKAWSSFGLPLKVDPDRKINVPDGAAVERALRNDPQGPIATAFLRNRESCSVIVSNMDVMLKASLQRTVLPGWWIVSYDGKNAAPNPHLTRATNLVAKAMLAIRSSPEFRRELQITLNDQGDPLDTAIGFPSYSSEMNKDGVPIARLKMLEQYKDVAVASRNWADLKEKMRARGANTFERNHLFAIAPIRRIQPGYKWAHVWKPSLSGLKFSHDERGHSTNRVAWMAPYVLNLLISPIHSEWKTIRRMIPGLYHDGDTRKANLAQIRKDRPFIFESDFSNYDRTIPNNVMADLFTAYTKSLSNGSYWRDALLQTQRDLPIVWGDNVGGVRGRGWVFQTDTLALLSGLKITAEVGTFMNLIINVTGWLATGLYSEKVIYDYLTIAIGKGPDWPKALQNTLPWVLIQSDDTLVLGKDFAQAKARIDAFLAGSKLSGISAKVELGDKFLMRHMERGCDRPVAARIWQNTLNNESPPDDPLKFMVGLVTRTDGMLGWKSFDPFQTGVNSGITAAERDISLVVINSLLDFCTTSVSPLPQSREFLSVLAAAAKGMKLRDGLYYVNSDIGAELDKLRKRYLQLLAQEEMKKLQAGAQDGLTQAGLNTLLYQLHKDKASPSAALALDQIQKMGGLGSNASATITRRENAFYRFAMKKLGVPLTID